MNLVAKVEFMKMSTPQEKALCVSWFIEQSQTFKHSETSDTRWKKVRDINDLQHRIILIIEAIDTVTVDMLARKWQEIEYRLDIVCATDGAHGEVY